jgi:hypothetical protein
MDLVHVLEGTVAESRNLVKLPAAEPDLSRIVADRRTIKNTATSV